MISLPTHRPAWSPLQWRWPLPAVAVWLLAWVLFLVGLAGRQPQAALLLALAASAGGALLVRGLGRRLWVASGFPASVLVLGAVESVHPAWWLLPLVPLLLVYPLRAWRDAPFFPTPISALDGVAAVTGQPARVLEAGCGAGHGLAALRRQFPCAELVGLEWSPLLALLARWRRPDSRVQRGDFWAESWSDYGLVYLFQRPESMARAWDKASREMPEGSWLASLEFPVPGKSEEARLPGADGRPLWLYRVTSGRVHSMAASSGR